MKCELCGAEYKDTHRVCNKCRYRLKRYGDINKLVKSPNGNRKKHPLYQVWMAMDRRCNNKNCREYKYYGGRGIKVCDRWHGAFGFDHFLEDMGERPDETMVGKRKKWTLDRIDNNGDYCPKNCRWVTMKDQCKNRREENMIWRKKKIG